MEVRIKYGAGTLGLTVPEHRFAGFWGLGRGTTVLTPDPGELARGITELCDAGLVEAAAGHRVGLLLADGTRRWSPDELLPPLLAALGGAAGITAFLCTGTHDPRTPGNEALGGRIRGLLGAAGPPSELVENDCRRHRYVPVGRTSRGTAMEIHERSSRCDLFLVLADMKNHYFAGYSNPIKYFIPGIASFETARGNHSLALEAESTFGRHPWHPDPGRRTNPLAEDMLEGMELALAGRPVFALTTFTADDSVLWAGGGRAMEAAARGMEVVDRAAGLEVAPLPYLVVSAGGEPHDESLYTAQRALELSRAAVRSGGEVLFLARCPNGIGPPSAKESFFDPLAGPLAEIRPRPREEYVMYSHKPVKFARYLEGLAALHVLCELPADEIRRVHMHPVSSPQEVLDRWVRDGRAGERIGFLDDASKLAVLPPRSRCRSR